MVGVKKSEFQPKRPSMKTKEPPVPKTTSEPKKPKNKDTKDH
jgi:hypothetical protein